MMHRATAFMCVSLVSCSLSPCVRAWAPSVSLEGLGKAAAYSTLESSPWAAAERAASAARGREAAARGLMDLGLPAAEAGTLATDFVTIVTALVERDFETHRAVMESLGLTLSEEAASGIASYVRRHRLADDDHPCWAGGDAAERFARVFETPERRASAWTVSAWEGVRVGEKFVIGAEWAGMGATVQRSAFQAPWLGGLINRAGADESPAVWASVPGVHTRSGEAFVFRINFVRTDDGRWIPVTANSMSTDARRRPWVIF